MDSLKNKKDEERKPRLLKKKSNARARLKTTINARAQKTF